MSRDNHVCFETEIMNFYQQGGPLPALTPLIPALTPLIPALTPLIGVK